MPALISVSCSEGVRTCDAKCYLATGLECDCVCGGRNHGVGWARARQNTVEMAEQIAAELAGEGRIVEVLGERIGEMLF